MLGVTTVAALLQAASASADLTITQTAAPSYVKAGGLVTITVTVLNNGPGEANGNLELFSLSPEGGKSVNDPYQSVTSPQGSCQPVRTGSYQVEGCSFYTYLASGAQAQVTAVVRVNEAMLHNATSVERAGNWSTLPVAVSLPPTLTGAKQIELSGLPLGCAPGDFTLTVQANVPRAKRIETSMTLGLRADSNSVLDWNRSRDGARMTVKVPVSRIVRPAVGKRYLLHVHVQRNAGATLSRTVSFEVCRGTS